LFLAPVHRMNRRDRRALYRLPMLITKMHT
jgi:hypothetical protein